VTFLDWEPKSLEIVALAAREQGLAVAGLVAADWRDPPPLGSFDRILAADVLYEARNVSAIARFLRAHLAPRGEAWIAEPGRDPAEAFPATAEAEGLALVASLPLSPRADGGGHVLHRLQRGR
jgi:2-polyprenyl-3-methyl-5-hydroxy-6-metoxy-1,4-benzoquinol methylase